MTYRDGDVAWPIRELSIPFVFFAHQNPVDWDGPSGLSLPNSTDDVLLFADMVRVLAEPVFSASGVADADALAAKLRTREPPFFTPDGERRTGEGEHVVVLRPQFVEGGRVAREGDRIVECAGCGDDDSGDDAWATFRKRHLDRMLRREGRLELAETCFRFLPTRIELDLLGWDEEDIFAHS